MLTSLSGCPGSPNLNYWETGVPPQSEESHPLLAQLGPTQLPQSVQEPLSESPDVELSISFKFSFVRSILDPRVMGKYVVHQVETPYLERLKLLLGGRLVSQGVPLGQTHPLPFIP